MARKKNVYLAATMVITLTAVLSACEISFPWVDCSGIDQPDMGGLVCVGLNGIALSAVVALIAVALGLVTGGGGA